jgi:hypothetical protein
MYDQYLRGNTFNVGDNIRLPKHKGFLFSGNANSYASFYIWNDQGNTLAVGLTFAGGISILPVQAYSVQSLASGLTGYRLN